jgi:nitroreductase
MGLMEWNSYIKFGSGWKGMKGMELAESIEKRKSIRAFRQEPVPREVMEEILGKALRAPSWGNTQPWKVTILGGESLQSIIGECVQRVLAGGAPSPDVELPRAWPEEMDGRYKENGRKLFAEIGIERGDRVKRDAHRLNMFRFFGAPQAIYLHQDRSLSAYSIFDAGLLAQNIALLAAERGLGACFLAVSVLYPDVIRRHTGIPETDRILIGLAIGYPDDQAPINQFRSEREPIENVVRWVD